jgi:hypothetical protein
LLPESTVVKRGNQYSVIHGSDESLLVRFYWNAVEEKHFVRINVPGDSRSEWDRPVKDSDKVRWADKWEAYQAKQSQVGNQVLLEDAGIFPEARVKLYKQFNIETVNQLAGMSDGFIQQVGMGTREDVKKANVWLQEQSSKHSEQLLSKALSAADDRIQALESQIQQLLAGKTEPAKRGPKPKGEVNDSPN